MSEEMVTRTLDSPAEASDTRSFSQALVDSISDATETDSATALNSTDNQTEELDWSWLDDISSQKTSNEDLVRQRINETLATQKTPENVPYDRFREVNEQAKAAKEIASNYEKWADIIQALEADGFKSGDDLRAMWAKQQEQNVENQIRQKYADMAQANVLSEDAAVISADLEIQRLKYEQLVGQVEETRRSQQLDQAFRDFPYARRGEKIVQNLVQRGLDPVEAASYVHTELANMAESLVPELAAMFEAQQQAPIPIDTSESAQPVIQDPNPVKQFGGVFSRLMGIGRNNNGL